MRTNPATKITPDATSNGIRSACGTNSAARTGMKEHAMTISHRSVFGDAVRTTVDILGHIRLRPPRDTVSRSSFVVVSCLLGSAVACGRGLRRATRCPSEAEQWRRTVCRRRMPRMVCGAVSVRPTEPQRQRYSPRRVTPSGRTARLRHARRLGSRSGSTPPAREPSDGAAGS